MSSRRYTLATCLILLLPGMFFGISSVICPIFDLKEVSFHRYSGHFPGVRDEIPGLAYSDTRRSARKDAVWANGIDLNSDPNELFGSLNLNHTFAVDRPNIWRPLVSREFSERGRSRDPNRALTDPARAALPEQHSPRNVSSENLDANILKPISNDDGIIPGYAGFVPHIRSNSIPGFNFKRLTRHKGETARLNREAMAYMTENR
jgi:hypothetical protein